MKKRLLMFMFGFILLLCIPKNVSAMQIFVKVPKKPIIALDVEQNSTIYSVKEKISDITDTHEEN